MTRIHFVDGHVTVTPPTRTRTTWRVEVWKRHGLWPYDGHVRTDLRQKRSEKSALITAKELATHDYLKPEDM